MAASKIEGHLAGIDFEKPVEVINLPKGKIAHQYQVPNGPQGSYYAPPNAPPSSLGISSKAKDWNTGEIITKEVNVYEANSRIRVLKSTAAKIDDTWSIPGKTITTTGGSDQFFTIEKKLFSLK